MRTVLDWSPRAAVAALFELAGRLFLSATALGRPGRLIDAFRQNFGIVRQLGTPVRTKQYRPTDVVAGGLSERLPRLSESLSQYLSAFPMNEE
jgi:hypothetical protein